MRFRTCRADDRRPLAPLEPSQGPLAEVEGWGQGRAGGATIEKNGESTERDIQGTVLCAVRRRRRSRVPRAGFTDEGP